MTLAECFVKDSEIVYQATQGQNTGTKKLQYVIGNILQTIFQQSVTWNAIDGRVMVINPTTGVEQDCTSMVGEVILSNILTE